MERVCDTLECNDWYPAVWGQVRNKWQESWGERETAPGEGNICPAHWRMGGFRWFIIRPPPNSPILFIFELETSVTTPLSWLGKSLHFLSRHRFSYNPDSSLSDIPPYLWYGILEGCMRESCAIEGLSSGGRNPAEFCPHRTWLTWAVLRARVSV